MCLKYSVISVLVSVLIHKNLVHVNKTTDHAMDTLNKAQSCLFYKTKFTQFALFNKCLVPYSAIHKAAGLPAAVQNGLWRRFCMVVPHRHFSVLQGTAGN